MKTKNDFGKATVANISWSQTVVNLDAGCHDIYFGGTTLDDSDVDPDLCNEIEVEFYKYSILSGYNAAGEEACLIMNEVEFEGRKMDILDKDISLEFTKMLTDGFNNCPECHYYIRTTKPENLKKIGKKLNWSPNMTLVISADEIRHKDISAFLEPMGIKYELVLPKEQ